MARQRGIHKLEGTIDDLTYYQRNGKLFARKRTTLRGDRIRTDPAFARVQETYKEFGLAAKSGKLIRSAFGNAMEKIADGRLALRLNSLLTSIKVLDMVNPPGSRTVDLALDTPQGRAMLTGFCFNPKALLDQVLQTPVAVDVVTGVVSITGLIPKNSVRAPFSATHFSVHAVWARIDFAVGTYKTVVTNSAPLPIDFALKDIELIPAFTPQSNGRNLFALTLRFYKSVSGILLPLNDAGFQAGGIVGVG